MKFHLDNIIILLLLSCGLFTACSNKQPVNNLAGINPCVYQTYSGVLTNLEAHSLEKSYKVHYKFKPDSADAPSAINPVYEGTEILTEKQFLRLDMSKPIHANIKYIVSGTCAPGPFLDIEK